jgi:acetyltransferase-like isoleucine patch superfamily enzyme
VTDSATFITPEAGDEDLGVLLHGETNTMPLSGCNIYPEDFAHLKAGENLKLTILDVSKEILKKISIVCGNNCEIVIRGISVCGSGFSLFAVDNTTFDMGGDQVFVGYSHFYMHEPSAIKIGGGCLWSSVDMMTSDCHSILDLATQERINHAKDIIVGDRVWFGMNVTVLKGAEIGSDTVVAAG